MRIDQPLAERDQPNIACKKTPLALSPWLNPHLNFEYNGCLKVGEVPEWTIGAVSKTVVALGATEGSNPSLSAEDLNRQPPTKRVVFDFTEQCQSQNRPESAGRSFFRYKLIDLLGWLSFLPQRSTWGSSLRYSRRKMPL